MRKGQNPAKMGLAAYRPRRLGIAILVYIPSLHGYFEHLLSILKDQIASIYHSTPQDFDLMVFDNGSCPEVQADLQRIYDSGSIEWLICSQHNLGKTGAMNWILGAMPNELICYTDSDVLFRSGWLEGSMKLFGAFPRVGMVAAQPCLYDQLQGSGEAHKILENDPRYCLEQVHLDPQVVDEFIRGIGLPEEKAGTFRNAPVTQVTDRETGAKAVLGATHMQFMITRELARNLPPLPATRGLSGEEDRWFDRAVDQAGYLHLSTPEAYVYHIGNQYDETSLHELEQIPRRDFVVNPEQRGLEPSRKLRRSVSLLKSLPKATVIQNALRQLYNILYEYHSE